MKDNEKFIKFVNFHDEADVGMQNLLNHEIAARTMASRPDPITLPWPEGAVKGYYDKMILNRLEAGMVLPLNRLTGAWEPTWRDRIRFFIRHWWNMLEEHVGAEPEYNDYD